MEGAAPSRRGGTKSRTLRSFSGPLGHHPGISEASRPTLGEVGDEEGEESMEEEDSGENEVADSLANDPEVLQSSDLALSSKSLVSQIETSLLKMMNQINKFMGKLTQAVTPRGNSKAPEFKTLSMKAPDSFDGTQANKLRGFIQSCQLIFHNDPKHFFPDRKKVLYPTSFLTTRTGKWIELCLPNISNEDPSYLLNNWQLF
ncbi:hypothetical protein O181_040802 [Austropuccinia psidii MF-1]|uniref:Uncharacterized protein n=1 Tax=Austropuccinia psidii MF-1 TaxID=1389203 RepID=A0A9Q3HE95_9BASI|nr:hypothetical protein [Austropuccinia psidii MF-1]